MIVCNKFADGVHLMVDMLGRFPCFTFNALYDLTLLHSTNVYGIRILIFFKKNMAGNYLLLL